MLTKKPNAKLATIRDRLIDAVEDGLRDEKQRSKASFLGVAVSLLRLHGGPDQIQTPDEAAEAVAALRTSISKLPFPGTFDDPEDQEEEK